MFRLLGVDIENRFLRGEFSKNSQKPATKTIERDPNEDLRDAARRVPMIFDEYFGGFQHLTLKK
jgi:hypothetical protein